MGAPFPGAYSGGALPVRFDSFRLTRFFPAPSVPANALPGSGNARSSFEVESRLNSGSSGPSLDSNRGSGGHKAAQLGGLNREHGFEPRGAATKRMPRETTSEQPRALRRYGPGRRRGWVKQPPGSRASPAPTPCGGRATAGDWVGGRSRFPCLRRGRLRSAQERRIVGGVLVGMGVG